MPVENPELDEGRSPRVGELHDVRGERAPVRAEVGATGSPKTGSVSAATRWFRYWGVPGRKPISMHHRTGSVPRPCQPETA